MKETGCCDVLVHPVPSPPLPRTMQTGPLHRCYQVILRKGSVVAHPKAGNPSQDHRAQQVLAAPSDVNSDFVCTANLVCSICNCACSASLLCSFCNCACSASLVIPFFETKKTSTQMNTIAFLPQMLRVTVLASPVVVAPFQDQRTE